MNFQIPKLHFTEQDNQKQFPHSSFGAPLPGLAIQPSVWRESQRCPDFPKQLELQVKHRLPWCSPTHWFAGGVDAHGGRSAPSSTLLFFYRHISEGLCRRGCCSAAFACYSKLSALYTRPVIKCHLELRRRLWQSKNIHWIFLFVIILCRKLLHNFSFCCFVLFFFLQEAWKVSHTLQNIMFIFSFTCN